MPALGEEFRSAREARGLTLSDVAEAIHIRSVYLSAIESEDWKSIGAPVYVRGFLRTYARFLGLDAEDAVSHFNASAPPERPSAASAVMLDEREGPGISLWAVVGAVAAVLLVAFVVFEYWQYARGGGTPVSAVTASPQARPAATPAAAAANASAPPASGEPSATAAPGARRQIVVRLTQRSWLRVTVDGATQHEGIFPAGTTWTFTGNVADVRAGNAGGVSVAVNGRPPAPMGKDGDVVEQRFTL